MALKINPKVTPLSLRKSIERMFERSGEKIRSIEKSWDAARGTPVFTVKDKYTSRGWTEWTQGFQFGSALLQFEATGEKSFLELGRERTTRHMASHVSHIGVHDHGFNNVSTYGNLRRLMRAGLIPQNEAERNFYEMALKVSGAVQAARWTAIANGAGYIYSFNGPHSLFIDTMRSLRSLALAHQLGHSLMGERDRKISLLERLIQHALTTAQFAVYYGEGRDAYDVPGRTAHESIFNTNDGNYRCPNSQQGYSPFSTWTRGLAWAILGYAEQLEFLSAGISSSELDSFGGGDGIRKQFLKAARATADFYLENSCVDGIPMWDTGAPNLHRLGAYLEQPSDPFNAWEPVDSSAAAIAAQGLIRLGQYLKGTAGAKYAQAGGTILETLLNEPYLSTDPKHQGLLLHSVYHRPNGWDHIARGQRVPNGESSMWGDYHLREAALLVLNQARGNRYLTFFDSHEHA
jgi:unsaturated chondroitin disaccharide hydrolase